MPTSDNNPRNLVIASAVLTGLTPLIPVPFVDDIAYTQFMRRMTNRLAATHDIELNNEAVKVLSDAPKGSCLPGCLGTVVLYPIKKIFRKIFFFLEWKRAVDIVSRTFYHGHLLNFALREGYVKTDNAVEVRAAIDRVLQRVDTRLLERTVRGVFRQSKDVLRGASDLLASSLSGKTDKAEQAVADVEELEEQQVAGVIGQMQSAIAALPAEHFESLEAELARELGAVA